MPTYHNLIKEGLPPLSGFLRKISICSRQLSKKWILLSNDFPRPSPAREGWAGVIHYPFFSYRTYKFPYCIIKVIRSIVKVINIANMILED